MKCITIFDNVFFEASGQDKQEAIERLKKRIEQYMKENKIGGRYEMLVMCVE